MAKKQSDSKETKGRRLFGLFKNKENEQKEGKLKNKTALRKPLHYLVEPRPYIVTPSYIHHNGRVMSILQLYVRPGSNRSLTQEQIIGFIPTTSIDNSVELILMSRDFLIKDAEKNKIIRKTAALNKKILDNIAKDPKKNDDDSTMQAEELRQKQAIDYANYESIIDNTEPIVVFDWRLLIIANSEEDVEAQIETLNMVLNQKKEGAKWDALAGDQLARFENLFQKLPQDKLSMTSTGENYSGLGLAINTGLNDPAGIPVGKAVLSLTDTTSFFDFDHYTKRYAIIAATRSSLIHAYSGDNIRKLPASSIIAQTAANHIVLGGNKAHHIVLNKFDYFLDDIFFRPNDTEGILRKIDMAHQTINPMQGFGSMDDLLNVYARLIEKIKNLFNILQKLSLTPDDLAIIGDAARTWYLDQQLWTPNPDANPHLTRIVNIPDPSTYPNMSQFLSKFKTMAMSAAKKKRELRADRIDTLGSVLQQALNTYGQMLARPTNIVQHTGDKEELQIFYDFSTAATSTIKEVLFVNSIDYIIHYAKPGDVIVIHGVNELRKEIMEMVYDSINSAAENKGIKFIFAFDTIISKKTSVAKAADMFDMIPLYYSDLDLEVDWSIIGHCQIEEIEALEKALNKPLGLSTKTQLAQKISDLFLIHRREGSINSFVKFNSVI